ncbi:ParB N-terminal domain-containing protein [Candidatus Pacearchaeota archaeon]|jgi:hypothetical protein|nr:ParB N-terminal domain-containing protein [Candidatus Pacearchaeota archaeon]
MKQYKIDPELKSEIDKYLPPLSEDKYQELKANIAKKGYDEAKPIVIWEERPDTIVDGHHRYRACQELGIEPFVVEKSFKSMQAAVVYAIRGYITGRVLTPGQIVIATEHAMTLDEEIQMAEDARNNQGKRTDLNFPVPGTEKLENDSVPVPGTETKEVAQKIADKAKVSVSTVYSVHAIKKEGVPELLKLVESGEVGAKTGKVFVKQIPNRDTQLSIIASRGAQGVKEIAIDHYKKNKEAEEQRKFAEFNKDVAEKTAIAHAKIDRVYKAANGACLLPNVSELFCDDCQWGFDAYLPAPHAISCPYCKGDKITKRDDEWNSREVV